MNRLALLLIILGCSEPDLPAAAPAVDAPSEEATAAPATPAPEDWRKPFSIPDPCAFTESGPNYCDRRTDTKSTGPLRCFENYDLCRDAAWKRVQGEQFQRDLRDWLDAPPPDPCEKFPRPQEVLTITTRSPCRPAEDGKWAIFSGFLSVYPTRESCEEGRRIMKADHVSYEMFPDYLTWRAAQDWSAGHSIFAGKGVKP